MPLKIGSNMHDIESYWNGQKNVKAEMRPIALRLKNGDWRYVENWPTQLVNIQSEQYPSEYTNAGVKNERQQRMV